MGTYSRLFAMVIYLSLIALTNAFGQTGIDDSQMRKSAADRIMKAHDIEIDWRNTSLLEITDIEMRLKTVERIKRDHGISFDWRKKSLLELTDGEARMNTAKRIGLGTGKPIDWKEYSLEDLLRMESGLSQANTNPGAVTLSFEVLFPPTNQQAMGLHKLTEAEKEELRKHVETLLFAAVQARYQQSVPQATTQQQLRAPAQQGSVIESKVDGEFEGWEGETIVKLMNGQIWQQTEYYYHYRYSFMPDVLIYKEGSGWKMKVEGIDKAVRVRLIEATQAGAQQQIASRENVPQAGGSVAGPKLYAGVGGGHWVKKNIDSGTYMLLEDGTLWEIDPFDKIDAMLWLPISDITVIESSSGSPGYNYLLINTDDGEKAHAKYMGKQ